MNINVKTKDKAYAQALALTLAGCLKADVVIDAGPEFRADFNLCDSADEQCFSGRILAVSKYEPVTKIVEILRAELLKEEDMPEVDVKAIAVTGMGGSGVSTIARILAGLLSELFGKRVLLVSFNGIGGPCERHVYDLLTAGTLDLNTLAHDDHKVLKLDGERHLNPFGRLSRTEAAEVLARLGHIPGLDLIVIDVPVASPHWSLCMKVSETVIKIGTGTEDVLGELIGRESSELAKQLCFENRREKGVPDMLSETGAALRRFVREELC